MSLASAVQATLARHAEGMALEYRERTFLWRDVRSFIQRLDAALGDLDCAPGSRVGVVAACSPAVVSSYYGLMGTDRTTVVVNPFRNAEAIAAEISTLSLGALLLDRELWNSEAVASAVRAAGVHALVLEGEGLGFEIAHRARSGSRCIDSQGGVEMLTSGTTGLPKRIRTAAHTILDAARDYVITLEEFEAHTGSAGRMTPLLNFWPLTTIGGLSFVFHAAVEGRGMVLLPKFSVDEWLAAVRRYQPTVLTVPPAQLRMVVNAHVPRDALSCARLMRSANAPLDPGLRDEFERAYGFPIMSYYGATEFCGVVTGWPISEYAELRARKPGSVGRPRPGVRVRAVDPETGDPLPPRKPGTIQVVAGWVGPDWISTSDNGFVDEDDYLYLQGRRDGAINRGGFKVVPEVVVNVLRSHPAVSDAAVVGAKDIVLGEVPVAFVECRPGSDVPDEESLQQHVRKQLPAYQVPVRVLTLPALPRNPMMKVDMAALRALARQATA